MRGFIGLTKRNLLVYFSDIPAVVFSLLTSIIVLALYLLFLKDSFVDAVSSQMMGLESLVPAEQTEMLVNGILLAGVTGSALITIPYHCLQTLVKDRERQVDCDILATPIKRNRIILSYFLAAGISAFFVSSCLLTAGLLILFSMGDLHMKVKDVLCAYSTVLLGAVSATAFFMPVLLLFHSVSASTAFFGILSAASGFVIGAYVPISRFSETAQTICNLFPASHITILMRNHILNGLLNHINTSIGGMDGGAFLTGMREIFSFQPYLFGHPIGTTSMVAYVTLCCTVCIAAMVFLYERTYKKN